MVGQSAAVVVVGHVHAAVVGHSAAVVVVGYVHAAVVGQSDAVVVLVCVVVVVIGGSSHLWQTDPKNKSTVIYFFCMYGRMSMWFILYK